MFLDAHDHSRKYYEDDTGNCKWLKETKCTTEPRRKREKVCMEETFQVSYCHSLQSFQGNILKNCSNKRFMIKPIYIKT